MQSYSRQIQKIVNKDTTPIVKEVNNELEEFYSSQKEVDIKKLIELNSYINKNFDMGDLEVSRHSDESLRHLEDISKARSLDLKGAIEIVERFKRLELERRVGGHTDSGFMGGDVGLMGKRAKIELKINNFEI